MVSCSHIGSPPSFYIKDIHAIQPCTTIMVKVGWYIWMRKVQVVAVFSSRATVTSTPWIKNCTNNFPIEIQFPQRWYVMLYYNIIIQEHYLVEIWKQLCGPWKWDDKSIIIKYSYLIVIIQLEKMLWKFWIITSGI